MNKLLRHKLCYDLASLIYDTVDKNNSQNIRYDVFNNVTCNYTNMIWHIVDQCQEENKNA